MNRFVQVSISIDIETLERLDTLAYKKRISRSRLVRELIERGLEK